MRQKKLQLRLKNAGNNNTAANDGAGTAKRDANFENKRKMSYKEKREYEQLTQEIDEAYRGAEKVGRSPLQWYPVGRGTDRERASACRKSRMSLMRRK